MNTLKLIIRNLTPAWTWTKKCHWCPDNSPHSHHLTTLGRLHFWTFSRGGR